jgi:hypothetical protein
MRYVLFAVLLCTILNKDVREDLLPNFDSLDACPDTANVRGVDRSTETVSINAELQNEIQWTPYTTVQGGIAATSRANAEYPENFTIGKKTFAGSIVRYLCDTNNSLVNDFDETATLRIKAGQTIGGSFFGFDFNMPACSFTNRSTVSDLFTQSYDWILTDNNQALKQCLIVVIVVKVVGNNFVVVLDGDIVFFRILFAFRTSCFG